MEKTTLYLPQDLHLAISQIARREGRPQAAVIRDALRSYVDSQERPRLRSLGMGEDGELNAEDIQDWLAANWDPTADWDRE